MTENHEVLHSAYELIFELTRELETTRGAADPAVEKLVKRARAWDKRYAALFAVPDRINARCVWCGESMEVPNREQGGGRTKRFCSPAHRLAHHRWKTDPYAPEPPIGSTLTR